MRRIGLPVEELPDDALLAGFGAGDEELAVAFVRRFQAKVFGVALAVIGERGAAEDIAQRAFERAWRHARTYDPRRGSMSVWLSVIARNLAIDAIRVRPVGAVDPSELLDRLVAPGSAATSPEQAAISGESADELRRALRNLPPEQARAIVLAGIAGLSASQIAASEAIPLGTAKTRIRAAMLRLRADLREAGIDRA